MNIERNQKDLKEALEQAKECIEKAITEYDFHLSGDIESVLDLIKIKDDEIYRLKERVSELILHHSKFVEEMNEI